MISANLFVFQNFSHSLQRDSVRVEGKGKATICDVFEKEVPALYAETDSPRIAELRKELDHYDGVRKKLEDQREVISKKINGLDRAVGEIGKAVVNPGKDAGTVVINENLLNGLQKLFDYHGEQAEKLKEELRDKNTEIEKTIEIISKISDDLNGQINLNISNYSQ